ncbi:hypothetical protein [Paenibacillus endoradicis]|uniref:hypothetical protein n=1 Tax=Paenibacillus endoradicis TaxID=2972487 RepID=UPI00215921DA|nr:hypothetical protein [Paenibacillus endoradicis]MCR8660408.1 hypothetical protein [Paenibacillus endoradicis]
MTTRKGRFRIGVEVLLLIVICIGMLVSGCSNTNTEVKPEGTTTPTAAPSPMTTTAEPTKSPAGTNETEASNDQLNKSMIPEGVTVQKVIKEITVNKDYLKKVELLTDGGKLVTISDSKGEIVLENIEYDGVIKSVNGDKVIVKVEKGQEQTLTITSDIIVEDEDNLGLKSGVEIEWVINANGQIESVELDD